MNFERSGDGQIDKALRESLDGAAIGARYSSVPASARVPRSSDGENPRTPNVRRSPPTSIPSRTDKLPPLKPPTENAVIDLASAIPAAPRKAIT